MMKLGAQLGTWRARADGKLFGTQPRATPLRPQISREDLGPPRTIKWPLLLVLLVIVPINIGLWLVVFQVLKVYFGIHLPFDG